MNKTIDYHIRTYLAKNPDAQWDRVVNYVKQYVITTQAIILKRMDYIRKMQ